MAEYIDKNGLIEALNKFAPEHYNALVNQLITKYPTADVVEVVRCKDCIYYLDGKCINFENRVVKAIPELGKYYHICIAPNVKEEHFCSYGERKDA